MGQNALAQCPWGLQMNEQVVRYINEGSKKVNGWFFPPDMLAFVYLDQIQKKLNVEGNLCEVGVFEAKSLVLLSHFRREQEALVGYDLFPDDMQKNAENNLKTFGKPKGVTLVASDTSKITLAAIKDKLGIGLRFLHIDAGHEYHEVFHQLILFAPFIREGGIISMDDYQDREFPGIEAAVLDFCEIDRPRRFVPFFAGGNKMFLCERQNAAVYQRFLLDCEHLKDKCRLTRVKDFNILVGYSKLPVPNASCIKKINEAEFPLVYGMDEAKLAGQAARYDQITFGMDLPANL